MKNLKDKVTIVTGSAKGIGKGIAKAFIQEDAQVIVADVLQDEAEATAEEFRQMGGRAEAYQIDLTHADEIEKMIDYVAEKYGRIDVLVNNAGINIREWATDYDLDKMDFVMNLNLRAYFVCARCAARYMKKQGKGAIVCTSSTNSARYTTKRVAYNTSKAAVNGLVGTLGVEWGRFGIRINAVAPGYVMTDMVKEGIAEGNIDEKKIMSIVPMKRFLDIEEIANAAVFLASDEASGITGQTLFVDGGWSKCGLPEGMDGP